MTYYLLVLYPLEPIWWSSSFENAQWLTSKKPHKARIFLSNMPHRINLK